MEKSVICPFSLNPFVFALINEDEGLILWEPHTGKRTLLVKPTHLTRYDHLQLYCHAPYICVVENSGTNGLLVNTSTHAVHLLKRGNYHADHCKYPIGFLEREGKLLLIHGSDWNRLDIIRLSDFCVLTEREPTKENSIDYFLSSLVVSPDNRQVAVNGWHWNPVDLIRVYSIDDFFTHFDSANHKTDWLGDNLSGYNWDRPCCWVDEHTLAVGYNPNEGVKEKSRSTIVLYDTSVVESRTYKRSKSEGDDEEYADYYYKKKKTIPFDGFYLLWEESEYSHVYNEASGELYFDSKHQVFIGLNEQTGLYITDKEGNLLLNDLDYADYSYAPEFRMFYKLCLKPELTVVTAFLDVIMTP